MIVKYEEPIETVYAETIEHEPIRETRTFKPNPIAGILALTLLVTVICVVDDLNKKK